MLLLKMPCSTIAVPTISTDARQVLRIIETMNEIYADARDE